MKSNLDPLDVLAAALHFASVDLCCTHPRFQETDDPMEEWRAYLIRKGISIQARLTAEEVDIVRQRVLEVINEKQRP